MERDGSGPDVLVAGHICLDLIPEFSDACGAQDLGDLLRPGKLVRVGRALTATGGGLANTGLALHRLGAGVRLAGKVGQDMFGRAVLDILADHDPGLAKSMIVDPDVATSYTMVISPPGVDRIFLHHPGANDEFSSADVPQEALTRAGLFHFGYPPLMRRMYARGGAELAELFKRARDAGATTSLDMALPDPTSEAGQADWRAVLEAALPHVDIFLPSLEELVYMLRPEVFARMGKEGAGGLADMLATGLLAELGDELLALGARVAVIKLGEQGLYLRSAGARAMADMGRGGPAHPGQWADQELWSPCFRVKAVGATGAGDAAIAGFLRGLLEGLGPAECLVMAAAVGACNVEAPDALSGIRGWEETRQRVAQGWERHEAPGFAREWEQDPGSGVRRSGRSG